MLKRRRNSTDDEVCLLSVKSFRGKNSVHKYFMLSQAENQPPIKVTARLEIDLCDQPAHNVVVESSSCSSDDESSQYGNSEQLRSVFTDIDYNADSLLSPPSIPELSNYVLSPLENVARGESTPHSNKRAR